MPDKQSEQLLALKCEQKLLRSFRALTFLSIVKENLHPNELDAIKKLKSDELSHIAEKSQPKKPKTNRFGLVIKEVQEPRKFDWSSYMTKIQLANDG